MKHYINLQSVVALCRPWEEIEDETSTRENYIAKKRMPVEETSDKLRKLSSLLRVPVGQKSAILSAWKKVLALSEDAQEQLYMDALIYVREKSPQHINRRPLGKPRIVPLIDHTGQVRISKLGTSHIDGAPCLYLEHNGKSSAHWTPETIAGARQLIETLQEWIDGQIPDASFVEHALKYLPTDPKKAMTPGKLWSIYYMDGIHTGERFIDELPRLIAAGLIARTDEGLYYRLPDQPADESTETTTEIDI